MSVHEEPRASGAGLGEGPGRPCAPRGPPVGMGRTPAAFAGLVLAAATWAGPAAAYRPFDGTDADVAEEGTFELELGPVGYLRQSSTDALVVPSLVLNQGIQSDVELVLQTNRLQLLGAAIPGRPPVQYLDTGFFMKHVWRDGGLQDASGPSLATEAGPLFPTGPGQHAVGAIVTTILSMVTPAATFHFNVAPSLTVGRDLDLFASTIIEGPHRWALRPVTEVYVERDFGLATTYSWLLGVIWREREGLELDAGLRAAEVGGTPVIEGRLGLTWALQLWSDRAPKVEGPARVMVPRGGAGG